MKRKAWELKDRRNRNVAPRWGDIGWVGVLIPRVAPWAVMLTAVGLPEQCTPTGCYIIAQGETLGLGNGKRNNHVPSVTSFSRFV